LKKGGKRKKSPFHCPRLKKRRKRPRRNTFEPATKRGKNPADSRVWKKGGGRSRCRIKCPDSCERKRKAAEQAVRLGPGKKNGSVFKGLFSEKKKKKRGPSGQEKRRTYPLRLRALGGKKGNVSTVRPMWAGKSR